MVKNPPATAGNIRDPGLIPGVEDSLEEDRQPTPRFFFSFLASPSSNFILVYSTKFYLHFSGFDSGTSE